jgi:hypothetical protein
MSQEVPFIGGPKEYRINVAGESFYLGSFALLCGPRDVGAAHIEVRAVLKLQDDNPHDSQAVQVTISGYPVGHLKREHARAFRRTVKYGPLSVHEAFECDALICGGWANEAGTGHFGVRLDLQLADD